MAGDDSGLRRRREAAAAPKAGLADRLYDAQEYTMGKVRTFCQLLQLLWIGLAALCGAIYAVEYADRWVHGVGLREMLPNDNHYVPVHEHDNLALVLFNQSIAAHREFVVDARRANAKHRVKMATLDCDAHPRACHKAHLQVEDELVSDYEIGEDEPIVLFYHRGFSTEAWHETVASHDALTKPATRKERIASLVAWLDVAIARAEPRLEEAQQNRFNRRTPGDDDFLNDPEYQKMYGGGYPYSRGGYPEGMEWDQ
jgi:hypothetical protein